MFKEGRAMDSKVDYKEMYLKMVRASEKVMDILIKAQQECEEMYIEQSEDEEWKKHPEGQCRLVKS